MTLFLIFLAMTGIPTLIIYLIFRTFGMAFFGFLGGLVVFAIIGFFVTERDFPDMVEVPTSFEMELVSGTVICKTYSLPSTLSKYYIATRRGAYIAFYRWERSILFGTSTRERWGRIKSGVIDIKKVDSCSGFSKK